MMTAAFGLVPGDISANVAAAICAIAFLSGTARGLVTPDAIRFSLLVGPVYAVAVWFATTLFGRASERLFRAICHVLIAAAVIIGLPLLDPVLR